jgi:hypothetical protein
VKTISDTLGVARSNLAVQAAAKASRQRRGRRPQPERAAGRDKESNCRPADLRVSPHSCPDPAASRRVPPRRPAGQREARLPRAEGARPRARTPHRQRPRAPA